jgi:hypothetical protein
MKLQQQQHLIITPLSVLSGFERTILPKEKSNGWKYQIASTKSTDIPMDLPPKHQQILKQSRHIQAQLKQLTQGLGL